MRILIATTHRGIVGGVETYLRALLPALLDRGHEVALLHEAAVTPGHAAVDADAARVPCWHVARARDWRAARAWRPDVCYSQGLADPALEGSLLDGFPVALFAHNYHGTCISGAKRLAFPQPQPCGAAFGPACLARYFPRRCGGLNPATMLRQYRHQQRRRAQLPRYRAVFVASRHMREEYIRHGVAADRLHLLPLFPPGEVPDPAPPPERPTRGRVLLVGRLTDVKGGHLLVPALRHAAERLQRPLTLVVAGDGPERARLEAWAGRLQVTAEFHRWVGADCRRRLMRGADVLAVPSVWPEPFGLVGLEAACVGLPAVAFAVGGIPDWLRAGKSGELAPGDPPTVAGLADALIRALADPAYHARLRAGAWETASEFTLTRHVDRLERLLRDAVEIPAAPATA